MVDLAKIAAVKEWAQQSNAREICSFLGLAGYYRKFMEEFFKITLPLAILTRKGKKFE